MPLTIVPTNPPTSTTFKTTTNSVEGKVQVKYTPDGQPHLVIKKLRNLDITALKNRLAIITPANLINHLPKILKVELEHIHHHCNYTENIVRILNGQGSFHNRLIILLIKLNKFFTEHHFTQEQKKEAETIIDTFLTNGKINLTVELGKALNHFDKEYTERMWIPGTEDKTFFDKDDDNYRVQLESGEFFPKWMEKIEIAGIRISEVILAYWNFRHSAESVKKDNLSDDLIYSSNHALYSSLNELRKMKVDAENSSTGSASSTLALSWFHIKAIDQRLSYADKIANSIPYFKIYHWDGRNSATHKPVKKIKDRLQTKIRNQTKAHKQVSSLSTQFNASSSFSIIKEEHITENLQSSPKRTGRKRKANPRFQDSGDAVSQKEHKKTDLSTIILNTTPPKKEKPDTLEKTEIPFMVNNLRTILNNKEASLLMYPPLPYGEENPAIAEVISALDELTRLYSACRYEIKRSESKYTEYTETITEEATEELTEQVPSDSYDSPSECEDINPDDHKDVITVEDRNIIPKIDPDKLKQARSNFHALINKARELLFLSAICDLSLETPDDVQGWQSLETVINFPLNNLSNVLQIPHTETKTNDLKSKKLELFKKINDDIRKFRDKIGVWEIETAQITLNAHWKELMPLQYQLNGKKEQVLKNQRQVMQSSNNPEKILEIQAELALIKTEQRETALALYYLTSFSLRLQTKKHQELYEHLKKVVKEKP